jgi:translocation and assembly module TamB
MTGKAVRAGRFLGRAAAGLSSLVLIMLIVAQAGLWAGAGWLNTPPGQRWIGQQMNAAMAASGYKIELRGLHIFALQGFGVDEVLVSDAAGPVAEARQVRFYVEPLPALVLRHLSLALTADEVDIHRIPEGHGAPKDKTPGVLLQPFSLPNLYVRGVTIRHFAVEKLVLDQGVVGPAMVLAPKMTALFAMRDNHLRFDVTAGMAADGQPAFMPQTFHVKGMLDAGQAALTLDDLLVMGDGYKVTGKGAAGFTADGTIAMELHAASDDLKILSAGKVAGTVKSTWLLGGTSDNPALEVNGTMHLPDLIAKGLGDVIVTAHADHLTGDAAGRF